jgi:hypothetical protein
MSSHAGETEQASGISSYKGAHWGRGGAYNVGSRNQEKVPHQKLTMLTNNFYMHTLYKLLCMHEKMR